MSSVISEALAIDTMSHMSQPTRVSAFRGPASDLAISALCLNPGRRQRRLAAAARTQLENLLDAVPEAREVVIDQTWRQTAR